MRIEMTKAGRAMTANPGPAVMAASAISSLVSREFPRAGLSKLHVT
jgi:hypothetical protein